MLADIIKKYISDLHAQDELEREIMQWFWRTGGKTLTWDSLSVYQQQLLMMGEYGTSCLSHEQEKLRDAQELEGHGLVTMEHDWRHGRSYSIYTTAEGRAFAQQHQAR
jgi:hypothetical protein